MNETLRNILISVKAIAIFIALGAIASFIFYHLKKKDLLGGYIGGLVVGIIGALIGEFVLHQFLYNITVKILDFLSTGIGVNVIAGFLGAYGALYVMNKLNHNKERKKY